MGKSALCKLLSTVLTARLQIPFIATTNVTQTSLLKCLQPFPLCLVKSPTQVYTINANDEKKGYRSTHTQRRHPKGVLVSFTAPGKASSNLCAEACWYPEPILTLWNRKILLPLPGIESRALGRPVPSARMKYLVQKGHALMWEMSYLHKERTVFPHILELPEIFWHATSSIQEPQICRHRTKFVRHGDLDLCTPDLEHQP